MYSKIVLLTFVASMVFWSSANANYLVDAVAKQYPNYHGEVILEDDARHPNQICKKAFNDEGAFWANVGANGKCDGKILCQRSVFPDVEELNENAPEGSIRTLGGPADLLTRSWICFDGTFHRVYAEWESL